MIRVPLERPVWAKRMYISPEQRLGEHLFGFGECRVKWCLEFEITGRNNPVSIINFEDYLGLTQKLCAEVYFQTQLGKLYELTLKSLTVSFGYESSSKYDKTTHTVTLGGFGHHSFLDWNPSDFNLELRAGDTAMSIIDSLLQLALKEH